jgi:hypothetical protein
VKDLVVIRTAFSVTAAIAFSVAAAIALASSDVLSARLSSDAEYLLRKKYLIGLITVFGLGDFVVGAGEHIANNLAIICLVLDHQNTLAHAASTWRST